MTYTTDEMNELDSTTGTRGDKIDVTGTAEDANLDRVEVTPSHDSGTEGTPVTASLREAFYIARGVELWDDNDNAVDATAYDKAGNTTEATQKSDITLETSAAETFTHDDAGCLAQDSLRKYFYDDEQRLVSATTTADLPIVEFAYDAFGRRIKKTICDEYGDPMTTIRYVYDGQSVIEEYVWNTGTSTWDLDGEYVHGPGIDNVLSIERKDGETWPRWYYHHDGLGSVSELTDTTGELSQAYEYDAWGTPTIYDPDNASGNTYLYTGREWDAEIALYYYRARHYAPQLGRFLQPDPIGPADGPNLYAYATNRPTIGTDPSGLKTAKGTVEVLLYSGGSKAVEWSREYHCENGGRTVRTDGNWHFTSHLLRMGDPLSALGRAIGAIATTRQMVLHPVEGGGECPPGTTGEVRTYDLQFHYIQTSYLDWVEPVMNTPLRNAGIWAVELGAGRGTCSMECCVLDIERLLHDDQFYEEWSRTIREETDRLREEVYGPDRSQWPPSIRPPEDQGTGGSSSGGASGRSFDRRSSSVYSGEAGACR